VSWPPATVTRPDRDLSFDHPLQEERLKQRRGFVLVPFIALVAMLALVPARPVPARADEPPGLTMTASAAYDGSFKYGEWLPIWVEMENSGPDLEAEINVRLVSGTGTSVFAAGASLPTGSRKRIPLYVLPNNFTHELEVQLVKDKQVLLSQKLAVTPRPNLNYLVGLIAPQRGALSILSTIDLPGQKRPKELLDLTLADVPERAEGLRSLDVLILNDVDTSSLTPQQKRAITTWVRQGGRLIIGGGAGAQRTAAGLPGELLPLSPRGETEVDSLPGLSVLAADQQVRVPGPFVIATGDETEGGSTLASQDGTPLVRERTVGSGAVDFVALDLTTSPFDAWSGAADFWESLLSPGGSYPDWLPPDASLRQMRSGQMTYALSNLPSLDLPSVRSLAVLLAVYILLVGPVNYLVLRWRKRLHWAWVTIPVLTIAFAAGAFGLAYAQRGTDLILNKIAVVQLQPDGTAMVNSYVGLFSPAQQSYQVEVAGGGLLSPLNQDYNPWSPGGVNPTNEMVFVQGDPALVRGLTVNQWSMQTFATEGQWAELGPITGTFTLEGDQVVGTVHNGTPYQLTGVVLILGSQFVRLADIPAGQDAAATMSLPTAATTLPGNPVIYRIFEQEMQKAGPNGPPREAQLKQSVLESVLQPGGWFMDPMAARIGSAGQTNRLKSLTLIAWVDQAPPEVTVARRSPAVKTTALIYGALPFRTAAEGRVTLPPGLLQGRLTQLPTEGGTCGSSGSAAVYIARGNAIFEFHLPQDLADIRADELNLAIATDGGWMQPPTTAIYDWEKQDWSELQNQKMGSNVISGAASLVGPDGLVRVRLSSEGGTGGCYYLELGVTGTR
jgi:hypothetical protein